MKDVRFFEWETSNHGNEFDCKLYFDGDDKQMTLSVYNEGWGHGMCIPVNQILADLFIEQMQSEKFKELMKKFR